ncbi:MAG: hypothetical protein FWG55_00155 [Candidatus Bathyarchaeota archaeon]|nr:hypothetical protein [Candidatus Termiticorpusculum sp.]
MKNNVRSVFEVLFSILWSIIVFVVSSVLFSLNEFNSLILSLTIFIGWRIIVIWLRHEKSLDAFEELLAEQKVLRDRKGKIKSTLLNVSFNWDNLAEGFSSKKPFIVDLYDEKIVDINTELESINNGGWIPVEPDIFRRYPYILSPLKDDKNNYFYALSNFSEIKWFSSEDGASYLLNIDDKINDKSNIKRLFILNDGDKDNPIVQIFFQLHKNSGYKINGISWKKMAAAFAGFKTSERPSGFGIYGQEIIWKNMEGRGLYGELSVNPEKIKMYTDAFNKAWDATKEETPHISPEIMSCCINKKLEDLSDVIALYKQKNQTNDKREQPATV